MLSPEGVIHQVNPAACEMLGYPREEILGMSIGDIFEEEGEEQAGAFMGTWLEALIRTGACVISMPPSFRRPASGSRYCFRALRW